MSRSYKKVPIVTDNAGSKEAKRTANRKFRREYKLKDFSSKGCAYRKNFCSWIIRDYALRYSKDALIHNWYSGDKFLHKHFKSLQDCLDWWKKTYISK